MYQGRQPQQPVYVINQNAKREQGRKAQLANIEAGKVVSDIIRSTLGPRAMLKMILDMMGQVVLTNDGNAILREIDVQNPAAKTIMELARTQDEQVGDGTTSVIVLAGEILSSAEAFIRNNYHPTKIIKAYLMALEHAEKIIEEKLCKKIDTKNFDEILEVVKTSIGTKFTFAKSDFLCGLAINAVQKVIVEENGRKEIDVKRYVRIEKIPGGMLSDSCVLNGLIINKSVLHPKMRKLIKNPKIVLLDCPIEYKKSEANIGVHMTEDKDFEEMLRQEEEYIRKITDIIGKFKPDIVLTEKGCSELAQHIFFKNNISVLRRFRKTDMNRLARAIGANIVHRVEDLKEEDIGTGCGLFEERKIGDDYFSYFIDCKDPKACSLVLRGGSKDVLNEIERNLHDAMGVVRNLYLDPRVVPGGGAVEMSLSTALMEKSNSIKGIEQLPYQSLAVAFEVIPRTLCENAGAKTIRVITELRAKHSKGKNLMIGINGRTGELADMTELRVWEPFMVKMQTIKTAIEASCLILRIDDVVSGVNKDGTDKTPMMQQGQNFQPMLQ